LLITEVQNFQDIENLIKKVKKRVLEKTGINLELEIKIIGD
jgi:UDP-N-acetylmuramate dehydrogenase